MTAFAVLLLSTVATMAVFAVVSWHHRDRRVATPRISPLSEAALRRFSADQERLLDSPEPGAAAGS